MDHLEGIEGATGMTGMDSGAKTMQERRRELLRRRIAESGMATKTSAERAQVRAGERYRLSAGQRRMWFLQAMDPADATLNICVSYRLTGAVDDARLHQAFNDVVARHTVLRTTYHLGEDGEPYQLFHDGAEIPWSQKDLTGLAESDRESRIATLVSNEFGRPFDLSGSLPLRVRLIRTAADEFVLVFVVHHICWDDDCWAVFFDELSLAYDGRRIDGEAPQYVAVEVLTGIAEPAGADNADLDYWKNALRPLPDPVELPGAGMLAPSRHAERRALAMPVELHRRAEEFARRHSATLFMVSLAVFAVLLRRYSGATDLLIAVPVTDRRPGAEGAIGYFGNTLLLRLAAEADDTFASLVDAAREICLAGFAHQSAGIDRVVGELNPQRTPGHDGLDQLVRLGFSMRKSARRLVFDGVTVRQLDSGAVSAAVPLALAIVLEPDGVFVEFEYQTDVLNGALVDQMLTHYLVLLDSALREPESRVATLDLLGAQQRAGVLAQSHGELVATPASTLVAMLESAAAIRPDAVALVSDHAELSYADLHRRANRLARWLIDRGFGTEDVVGLRMAASVEFVVAAFAVLKAGAAYLPVDPAYPDDRIAYLVADSRPGLVIGPADFDAAEQAAAPLSGAAITDADRVRPLRPENLAYVIYTSGSTGRPKGVAVCHAAIADHVAGFIAEWTMTAEDRLLQSTSVSFDASLAEIFLTLSIGAALVVPASAKAGTVRVFEDIGYLTELITRHRITVLHMVPSVLSTLLQLPRVDQLHQLRRLPVGGEALPGPVADKFTSCFDAELRNHYGPTEAVVCSTHQLVEGACGTAAVPIGLPNRNVYTYVLDQGLQPVPAQVVGELYLGGGQLARGYLGRPALTAQRFIADPFNPGMRLYRSGDLVRRKLSGELEFVGRADEQVKVRGFRIEPGEIESVITSHPGVRDCRVVAQGGELGSTLAAFLVAATDLDLDEVRAHAAASLPDYLLPTAFAVIPEIPLTVSGKLDKRALPAPAAVAAAACREPATPTERRVCSMFAQLFNRERVGVEDSFFALGGHSLSAARLTAQIRAEFGVELTVRAVFDTPTPAGLAARLVDRFRAEFDLDLDDLDQPDDAAPAPAPARPPLATASHPQRIPLSYSQLAGWFQYRIEGACDAFNMPLVLRFDGPLDTIALTEAVNDVVACHDALRTNFGEQDGIPYQFVHPRLRVPVPVRQITASQVDETVAELRRQILTPESGPLLGATLLAVGPGTHVLVVIVHHLVSDHVSLGIIGDDLAGAYRARLAGHPGLDSRPFQFADYVLWQRDTFDAPDEWGRSELAYWQQKLAGLPDEVAIPPDRPRPPLPGRRGQVATFTVPAVQRSALLRLGQESGATEFMVYQAVAAALLHQLGAGTDIALGSPVASRVETAAANLAGLFANVVVLRTDLSGDPSPRTVIARSRDTVLDAFAHQEAPVERLVDLLKPARSGFRNPLYQTMLHFRGEDWALAPRDLTGSGHTTVRPLAADFDVSLLDLDLAINVTADRGLDVRVVANSDLYEPQTVRHIADTLKALLGAFPATPDRPVSALQLPAAPAKPRAAPVRVTAGPPPVARAASAETERVLITLLEELLEITRVGREDNFFALGGDSIISIKWSAAATARGLTLTPAMVFEHMTIGELAAAVEAAGQPEVQDKQARDAEYAPMSASGLSPDALARLTAAWQDQS